MQGCYVRTKNRLEALQRPSVLSDNLYRSLLSGMGPQPSPMERIGRDRESSTLGTAGLESFHVFRSSSGAFYRVDRDSGRWALYCGRLSSMLEIFWVDMSPEAFADVFDLFFAHRPEGELSC